jgi:hypothetical protein
VSDAAAHMGFNAASVSSGAFNRIPTAASNVSAAVAAASVPVLTVTGSLLGAYRGHMLAALIEAGLLRSLSAAAASPHPLVSIAGVAMLRYCAALGSRVLPTGSTATAATSLLRRGGGGSANQDAAGAHGSHADALWHLPDLIQVF